MLERVSALSLSLLTSFMRADQLTIETDLSLVVDSLEYQLYPLTPPGLSQHELPPVDHPLVFPNGSHDSGQGRLHTERNPDFLPQGLR